MFAIRLALAAALLGGAGAMGAAYGQTAPGSVEVKRLTGGDLQRTAHRLEISEERLRQARQVLEEATDYYQEVDLKHLVTGSPIPAFWVKIHRLESPERLSRLIAERRREVSGLQEAAQYRALTHWAVRVAADLARLHPSRALEAVQSWPAPPNWLGEQANAAYEQIQTGPESEEFQESFAYNPATALHNLVSQPSGWRRFYPQFNRIRRSGNREDANRLIDEAILEMSKQPSGRRSDWEYARLLQQANSLPHDRASQLQEAFLSAFQQPRGQDSANGRTYLFEAEGQEVALEEGEFRFLQRLGQFHRQPETILKLVDSWPSLKDKFDLLGGVDRAMHARPSKIHQPGNPEAEPYPPSYAAVSELIRELRFDALSRPWQVRQRLEQIAAQDGEFFDELIRISRAAKHESPELAHLALQQAEALIEQTGNPQSDLARFMQFAHSYADFEGALTPKLIQQGFTLTERLEEAKRDDSLKEEDLKGTVGLRRPSVSPNSVESFLVGQWARINLDEALFEARSQEDPGRRLQLLLAMIRSLADN